jgi:hypothetical protein
MARSSRSAASRRLTNEALTAPGGRLERAGHRDPDGLAIYAAGNVKIAIDQDIGSLTGIMDAKIAEPVQPKFELFPSRQFPQWLAEVNLSLAFTTYQAGKVIFIGLQPNGRLSVVERTFNRCMGLWSDGQSLWMSTLYQLWRFENALGQGELHDGYDRVFVPQLAYTTGDLDIHDLALDRAGRPIFVNTLFSCLATISEAKSFRPPWRPGFISKLAPEDRCHLNGLSMQDGAPVHVRAAQERRSDLRVDGDRP